MAVRVEMGRYPIIVNVILQPLRFWCHSLHSGNVLLKVAYRNALNADLKVIIHLELR